MNQNSAFLNDKGLLEIVYVGDQSHETVTPMVERAIELTKQLRERNQDVLILGNLEQIGKSTPSSREATIKGLKSADYDRIAIFSASSFIKGLANLLITAIRQGEKIRTFTDRQEAENWLLDRKDSVEKAVEPESAPTDLESYRRIVHQRLSELQKIIAAATIGEYSTKSQTIPEEGEFLDVFVGVQVLIENLQEKIRIFHQSSQGLGEGIVQMQSSIRTLGDQNLRYQEIFQAVSEGLLVTDQDRKVILLNPAAASYLRSLLLESGVSPSSEVELVDEDNQIIGRLINQFASTDLVPDHAVELTCHLRYQGRTIGQGFKALISPIEAGHDQIGSVLILHEGDS